MKFAYEDLSDTQFEDLVILLCQRLLGAAVQGFSAGADGGRDAKFTGTAELHPSKASPWNGTTIVQAKHTNGFNRSFSETDFFSPESKTSILNKEIPKIAYLRENNQLDHYMLFSNRRLSANAENTIREFISTNSDLSMESIYLCGLEQLEIWLKRFPEVAREAKIDPVDSPLIVSPNELSEVVENLAIWLRTSNQPTQHPPTPRINYQKKNTLNGMSIEYAKAIRRRYLKDTSQIQQFLAIPENENLRCLYGNITDEFQLKIISKRKDYQSFDEVLEYIIDQLFSRDAVLRQSSNKRLTRAILFYMYWNCDIGETTDASPD